MQVIPVLLSGGSGTRLWPLSRSAKPKQFLKLKEKFSLFQETVLRCSGTIFDPRPIIVASNNHRFLVAEELQELGRQADILLEPVARNSCPAIAVACLHALARENDALVLVLASDHLIEDREAFEQAVLLGSRDARKGHLVTFGIEPTRPATSYGYISAGEKLQEANRVEKFLEKPDLETAQKLVEGRYLWNSGNFLFSAATFIEELSKLEPDVLNSARAAYENRQHDLDFMRLDETSFAAAPSISVDHSVMEKTDRAAVLPVSYAWSDVGSWDAITPLMSADDKSNASTGDVLFLESEGNVVHSGARLATLVGVENMIVVTTRDAVLVAAREKAESVKMLVEKLSAAGRTEANIGLQDFRPWGNFEQLDFGEGYQVKRIVVTPGGTLSLQKHNCRAEHWIVVSGEAEVEIDGKKQILKANQSAYIPLGSVHRLTNRQAEALILIEVQTGDYLGEDDIIRLEDAYNRDQEPKTPSD